MKQKIKVLIDCGHGVETGGKRSPDGRLREWSYTRDIARRITIRLRSEGYDVQQIVVEDRDVPLSERVRRVNAVCREFGKENVILVSIHINAAGSDGKWHGATGWSAYTSRGKTKSDALAECLYTAAKAVLPAVRMRTDKTDGDSDIEQDFYILKNTLCPAVLTENLFQDNESDVTFLLTERGKEAITKLHCEGIRAYIKSIL